MRTDTYGQKILSERDLCDLYMKNPERAIKNCIVDSPIIFHDDLELDSHPEINIYVEDNKTTIDFDLIQQKKYKMPEEYQNLDIVKYVLDQCKTDVELQRVGQELLLYLEKDLIDLLKYLKYLVDTMRKYNIIWGVGRGSSVSSYVLYLIGVHKIDSIFFDLPIDEFLR